MDRREEAGGRETLKRQGKEHLREIGRRGLLSFTDRHFAGDRQQAGNWLRARAHESLINSLVDRELARRFDQGEKVASMELPVLSDPDEMPW